MSDALSTKQMDQVARHLYGKACAWGMSVYDMGTGHVQDAAGELGIAHMPTDAEATEILEEAYALEVNQEQCAEVMADMNPMPTADQLRQDENEYLDGLD